MRYCEKYGRMDCELEKLGVEAPHQPCYKAFVDYCLSNLLEIASGGYSTVKHEFNPKDRRRKNRCNPMIPQLRWETGIAKKFRWKRCIAN